MNGFESNGAPAADENSPLYREFLSRSAKEFARLPDNVLSLISGRRFLHLGSHLFEAVRRGQSRFALPAERIYDDLMACYDAQLETIAQRLGARAFRSPKRLLLLLRLLLMAKVIVPLTTRKPPEPLGGCRPGVSAEPFVAARDPATPPQASIVVVSYNRLSYLQTTLRALLATVGDSRYELIAVDNGSRDGSAEFLEDAHRQGWIAKLVRLRENRGTSGGYNQGFAAADPRSDYLMKLDCDIQLLSPGWLAKAIGFLSANRTAGFVALNLVNHPMVRLLPVLRVGGSEVMDFFGWPCGSAMIVPARIRREVGCFLEDPEILYAPDDVDYYCRVCRKGYRAFFLRGVRAYHQSHLDKNGVPCFRRQQAALGVGQFGDPRGPRL